MSTVFYAFICIIEFAVYDCLVRGFCPKAGGAALRENFITKIDLNDLLRRTFAAWAAALPRTQSGFPPSATPSTSSCRAFTTRASRSSRRRGTTTAWRAKTPPPFAASASATGGGRTSSDAVRDAVQSWLDENRTFLLLLTVIDGDEECTIRAGEMHDLSIVSSESFWQTKFD